MSLMAYSIKPNKTLRLLASGNPSAKKYPFSSNHQMLSKIAKIGKKER
jgi:hypothetical protein